MSFQSNTMSTKFTSNSVDYELLSDTTILTKLLERYPNFTFDYIKNNGLNAEITVFVDSPTQIKVNNSSFYEDFLMDVVYPYSGSNYVKSLKIKNSGITGVIMINIK